MYSDDTKKSPPLFRVQEINQNIRSILESEFTLIGIRGEISSFKAHPSGHWYFTLKDSHSQIQGVMFRHANQKMSFTPKVGEELTVWGKITVYEPRGSYQILSHRMERMGEGSLQKSFQEIKEKLHKEGLFDQKRPLPFLPKHIAIITSESGAALRDVLNVLNRRCKGIQVTLVPSLMEGQQTASSVIQALKQALKLKNLDLILITRGGGGAESLWPFNDEALARTVFTSPIPTVSAIGHEIDFTILDFVADLRAPTPSAAAELISKNGLELLETIHYWTKNLKLYFFKMIQSWVKEIHQYKVRLASPIHQIEDSILRCDDYVSRLRQYFKNNLAIQDQKIQSYTQALHQLNPQQVMKRGYSICFKGSEVVRNIHQLKKGDDVRVQLFKGQAEAQITKKIEDEHG